MEVVASTEGFFLCPSMHIFPLPPCPQPQGAGVYGLQQGVLCHLDSGWVLMEGSPARRLEGRLAGQLRSKFLGCWVPPSVDAPLAEDPSHSQESIRLSLSRHRNLPFPHSFSPRHWILHCVLRFLYCRFPPCNAPVCK